MMVRSVETLIGMILGRLLRIEVLEDGGGEREWRRRGGGQDGARQLRELL